MPKTVSVHNGSAANREHNRRNPRTTGQMPHIQQDLVHHNETWIDIPVREAYKQIFQTAVDDYNRRQSRPERKIRDYYNQIRKSAKKHTAYELIIQIGDKNDTGLSADNEIACLREYYNNWQQRNPNLFCVGHICIGMSLQSTCIWTISQWHMDIPEGCVSKTDWYGRWANRDSSKKADRLLKFYGRSANDKNWNVLPGIMALISIIRMVRRDITWIRRYTSLRRKFRVSI
mgnify:CR=1 FL=1